MVSRMVCHSSHDDETIVRHARTADETHRVNFSFAVIVSDGLMSPSPSTLSSLLSYNGLSKSRIQSLYSDISRQKHSNPTTYNSNITWWRSTLEALVSLGYQPNTTDTLVLHADQSLLESLRYEGAGKPLCLGTVIVSFLIACNENRGAD